MAREKMNGRGKHFMSSKAGGQSRQEGHQHEKSEGTKLGSSEHRMDERGIEKGRKSGRAHSEK